MEPSLVGEGRVGHLLDGVGVGWTLRELSPSDVQGAVLVGEEVVEALAVTNEAHYLGLHNGALRRWEKRARAVRVDGGCPFSQGSFQVGHLWSEM